MRLEWSCLSGDDCLRLSGWAPDALDRLRAMADGEIARRVPVFPSQLVADAAFLPSTAGVAGNYRLDRESLCFVPHYPFLSGTSYTVLVHRSLTRDADEVSALDLEDFDPFALARPRPPTSRSTRVVEIYPTAAAIPRNHLRFYVQFSAPMSEGFAETRIRLVQAETGEALTAAFLPMEHELWDPERRRVTILLDPARIKRGLAPHEELGYAMRVGTPVSLVVDEGFLDAEGHPLAGTRSRRYRVGPDVRARVRPDAWALEVPQAGSRDLLVARFDRPLDHALLRRCLGVVDRDGRRIDGLAAAAVGEDVWTFTPTEPWRPTECRLVVDTTLEDLAGNSVARVFDRDLADADHTPIAAGHISLAVHPGHGRPPPSTFTG